MVRAPPKTLGALVVFGAPPNNEAVGDEVEAIPPNIFWEDLALRIRSTGWGEVLVSCGDFPNIAEEEEANVDGALDSANNCAELDDCPKVTVDAVPNIGEEDEVVPNAEVVDDPPKIADGAATEAGWLLWPNLKLNPEEGAVEVA